MSVTEQTWFDITARENFEKHLSALDPEWCLQLGCFTGDATVWMLEHTKARITDIDNFLGSDEHGHLDMGYAQECYLERMAGEKRVTTYVGWTDQWLRELSRKGEMFDFIYIDADHHAAAVLRDAVMAWPMLHPGGLLAFDDYVWRQPGTDHYERPVTGINAFLLAYGDQLDVIERNAQLWVKKR